ncbi:RES family NAD+ phosphorylase [Thiocapsa marina]|uniref:RES domain protein n=1 Tax=Thiocapsa marina 5811 TaxID=768671 RepID=F9UBU7_9GAMM|nr:RES domain-containing protein [Thiocapsa marina]EGV18415.1 RES domain protein [Thiocapsa marina 5811]
MTDLSLGARFAGLVYRAHHPRWAYAPTACDGAARRGGRFNRPGRPALYTSLTPQTAWSEAQQGMPFKAQPMTLVAYRVDCSRIVRLVDPQACAAAGVDSATLNLDPAVERPLECVPRGVRQGATRRRSGSTPTRCNAGGCRAGRAPGVVAAFTQPVSRQMRVIIKAVKTLHEARSGQLPDLG